MADDDDDLSVTAVNPEDDDPDDEEAYARFQDRLSAVYPGDHVPLGDDETAAFMARYDAQDQDGDD